MQTYIVGYILNNNGSGTVTITAKGYADAAQQCARQFPGCFVLSVAKL